MSLLLDDFGALNSCSVTEIVDVFVTCSSVILLSCWQTGGW